MPKNKKYHPDYRKLYPGVKLIPEVLAVLNKSDRKMEYIEYELKHSRVRKNKVGEVVSITPLREDSFDHMQEAGQFPGASPSPEEIFFKAEERRELYRCLERLNKDERSLINALFEDKLTEREYAAKIGLTQKAVNKRKRKILDKLKKIIKI